MEKERKKKERNEDRKKEILKNGHKEGRNKEINTIMLTVIGLNISVLCRLHVYTNIDFVRDFSYL